MTVQLKKRDSKYADLTAGQRYVVIGIEADDFRIINDLGQPYLYPSRLFRVVDGHQDADWVTEAGDEGERYAYPPAFNKAGFFEDYFDGNRRAVATFWRMVNKHLSKAS